MNIERIKKRLIESEDMVLEPYDCPAGYLSIGVGRNLQGNGLSHHEMLSLIHSNPERRERLQGVINVDGKTMFLALIRDFEKHGITKAEALFLLDNDVQNCIRQLKERIGWFTSAPETIQEVLVDMCFNLGINKLMGFTTTLRLMGEGKYPEAAENMLKSKWARQVKKRAVKLARLVENTPTQ
jgi:lysozyme